MASLCRACSGVFSSALNGKAVVNTMGDLAAAGHASKLSSSLQVIVRTMSTMTASPGTSFAEPTAPLPSASRAPITNTSSALSLLRSQPSHYVLAHLVGRNYLLTPRDVLTVPRLRDVKVGDVLELSAIAEVGSRDYTLRPPPPSSPSNPAAAARKAKLPGQTPVLRTQTFFSPGTVSVHAVVVEHTKGELERIVKKKRRKGYRKTVQHKQTYTRIRIGEIKFGGEPSV